MELPEDLKYTKQHEWARIDDDGTATVGITDYAQEKLGDVVFVELPEEGDEIVQDESFGTVESVKAVSDLFAPLSGTVTDVNDALTDSPESLNEDPHGEAWLIRITLTDASEVDSLLTADEYKAFIATEEE